MLACKQKIAYALMATVTMAMLSPAVVHGQTPDLFGGPPVWACTEPEEAAMLEACPGVFNTDLLAEIKATGSDPMDLFKESPQVAAGVCSSEGCVAHITSMTCLPPDAMMISAICACHAALPETCGSAMLAAISSTGLLEETMMFSEPNDADIAAFKDMVAPFCAPEQTCMTSLEEAGSACQGPIMSMMGGSCCLYNLVDGDKNCLVALSSMSSEPFADMESLNSTEELEAMGINTVADLMLSPLTAVCEHQDCFSKMACLDPPSSEPGMNETNEIEELSQMCSAIGEGCVRDTISVCFDMDLDAFLQLTGGEGMFGARRKLLQDTGMDFEELFAGAGEGGAGADDPMMEMMMQMMVAMLGPILEPLCSQCCQEALSTCDMSAVPSMSDMTDLTDSGMCSMMNLTNPEGPCAEPEAVTTVGAFEAAADSHASAVTPFASVFMGLVTLFALVMHHHN